MSEEITEILRNHPDTLGSEEWRLNNLYYIKDEHGQKVRFQMNWAQKLIYQNMWFLNIILKARQLGMTTFIQLFLLDRCLFNKNTTAGVIAHTKEDAESFFDDKIKFAYDHLPPEIKTILPARTSSTRELSFGNGSKIKVGTSMRSGTVQYLHVSEYGKMCAKYPDKAEEVKTGSLNAVAAGQFVFIESTAEGDGDFKTMFNEAWYRQQQPGFDWNMLTVLDYKAFFFPWWQHPGYVLEDVTVPIPDDLRMYFDELEGQEGITLTNAQKGWYVKKHATQGDLIKQEYPATPEEAFSKLLEGVILASALRLMRKEGRICKLPSNRFAVVNTFWDLGLDDFTSIWFHQHVGEWHHFIKYYEYRGVDIAWYSGILHEFQRDYGWTYGKHYVPHDANKRQETGMGYLEKKIDLLKKLVNEPVILVPRVKNLMDGIEGLRGSMASYKIDDGEDACDLGVRRLENYRWQQDPRPDMDGNTVFRKNPLDNDCQHAADAIRQHAQGYRGTDSSFKSQMEARGQTVAGGVQGAKMTYTRKHASPFNKLTNPESDHIV